MNKVYYCCEYILDGYVKRLEKKIDEENAKKPVAEEVIDILDSNDEDDASSPAKSAGSSTAPKNSDDSGTETCGASLSDQGDAQAERNVDVKDGGQGDSDPIEEPFYTDNDAGGGEGKSDSNEACLTIDNNNDAQINLNNPAVAASTIEEPLSELVTMAVNEIIETMNDEEVELNFQTSLGGLDDFLKTNYQIMQRVPMSQLSDFEKAVSNLSFFFSMMNKTFLCRL